MFETYLGIPTDYVVIGLAALVVILLIIMIVDGVKLSRLRKKYEAFMSGSNAKSLEDSLIFRLEQVDELLAANAKNERNIESLFKRSKYNFQKFGLVKYDALQEMGGKLSFTLCMLDERNNGFVMNVVHSREGCYSYMKEIIDANAVVTLAAEEEQALEQALQQE
ncbi:MAG: DUF4446 family protein [Lachnospiraceae bacterium]|nr:DUF4446 family protein [Lachnospiraceae bacterium]